MIYPKQRPSRRDIIPIYIRWQSKPYSGKGFVNSNIDTSVFCIRYTLEVEELRRDINNGDVF